MKKSTFVFLLAALPSLAMANAKVVGNGGNTVVCQGDNGKIISAEVFDLYEGRALRGLSYEESGAPALEQALRWAGEIAAALGQETDTPDGFARGVKRIYASFSYLPPGTGLKPIPDSNEFIVPKNCAITQTANYQDDSHIYIDSDIWGHMSETQRAALILHEAVYEYYRSADSDSVRARRTVAYVVSGGKLLPAFNPIGRMGTTLVRCSTEAAWEAGRPATDFEVYRNTAGGLTLLFFQWDGHSIMARTSIDEPANRVSQAWPSLKEPLSFSGNLQSAVDGDAVVVVDFTDATHGRVRWNGIREELSCHQF